MHVISSIRPYQRLIAVAAVAMAILLCVGWAAGDGGDAARQDVEQPRAMARYVNLTDSLPRLIFADGLVSLNDRCMVRRVKLNPKMPPIYVSGEPVGFC